MFSEFTSVGGAIYPQYSRKKQAGGFAPHMRCGRSYEMFACIKNSESRNGLGTEAVNYSNL